MLVLPCVIFAWGRKLKVGLSNRKISLITAWTSLFLLSAFQLRVIGGFCDWLIEKRLYLAFLWKQFCIRVQGCERYSIYILISIISVSSCKKFRKMGSKNLRQAFAFASSYTSICVCVFLHKHLRFLFSVPYNLLLKREHEVSESLYITLTKRLHSLLKSSVLSSDLLSMSNLRFERNKLHILLSNCMETWGPQVLNSALLFLSVK